MPSVAVIIGSASSEAASGVPKLPISDRGAIALATARLGNRVRAYATDAEARCFARAAGVESVGEISIQEIASVDVILIGRGGCRESGDALPASLAEESGAALVYDVIDIQAEDDRLIVTRDLGRGARDRLSVRGRVVLVVSDNVVRAPYVSRYRINAQRAAARKTPILKDQSSGEPSAATEAKRLEWQPAAPRVRLGDHADRVSGRAVERMNALFGVSPTAERTPSLVDGSAEECARHLLRYLSHHGFVERGSIGVSERAPEGAVSSRFAERQPPRSAVDTGSIPARASRRPHLVNGRPLPTRGPFELEVDR
jgi:electron transfer flavoprotein alpha/beta subunit